MTAHQVIALMQFEREFLIEEEPKDTTRYNYYNYTVKEKREGAEKWEKEREGDEK